MFYRPGKCFYTVPGVEFRIMHNSFSDVFGLPCRLLVLSRFYYTCYLKFRSDITFTTFLSLSLSLPLYLSPSLNSLIATVIDSYSNF